MALTLPFIGEGVRPPSSPEEWWILLAFGLLTLSVASLLFYDALGRIEAGRAAINSTLEPVVAALLATWLLGQRLTPWGWFGLALVVAGVAGAYATRSEGRFEAPAPHL